MPHDWTVQTPLLRSALAIFCIWISLPTAARSETAEPPERIRPAALKAGACTVDITPTRFPISSNGSMTPRFAELAHDPLLARCLVLDDGMTTISLVVVDNCLVPREIFDTAKTMASEMTGIPESNMLCSATHTHTAVAVTPAFQSEVERDYVDFLAKQIAAGIRTAHGQLEPARIGWAVGSNARQVFNRRWYLRKGIPIEDPFGRGTDRVRMNPQPNSESLVQPAGPTDPEIPLLAVQALNGRPIAVWANYSLHYVGGVPAKTLSADYFGEFARQFSDLIDAQKSKPPFVAAMTNGTSGDINNINFFDGVVKQPPFEQIRIVANDVCARHRLPIDESSITKR